MLGGFEPSQALIRWRAAHRLRFFHVEAPPLRERHGDAALLASHFVARTATRHGIARKPVCDDTLAWFERYAWPGNVRELENLVSGEFLLTEGDAIRIASPDGIATSPDDADRDLPYRQAKARAVERFQVQYLRTALERAGGNISLAARLIGTERRHLGNLLRRHHLAHHAPDDSAAPPGPPDRASRETESHLHGDQVRQNAAREAP